MINLYSGTPGSGKSLHAIKKIKEYYFNKKWVITNFDVNFFWDGKKYGKYLRLKNECLNVYTLQNISKEYCNEIKRRVKEEEILLVIDEAQLIFNTREWSSPDRKEWISFFSQHRKLGYHIILISQHAEMLDKQIRALIEYEHIHRKIANLGNGGKILNVVFGGESFIDVTLYYSMSLKTGQEVFRGNKMLYDMYDTFTLF